MAPNQLIQNGSFSAGSTSWTGTDIELNPYTSYGVSGGSNPSAGTVTEMDGRSGYRTVLQQTVTVARDGQTGTFSFDTALRSALTGNPSSGAYNVQIINATTGSVILSHTISPTSTTWVNQSYTVTFPSAGNYIVRFTEAASGADDSLGSVLDNVSRWCASSLARVSVPKPVWFRSRRSNPACGSGPRIMACRPSAGRGSAESARHSNAPPPLCAR